jgi:restriction endonuclease-like protein
LASRKDLERQQRRWAEAAGVDYDARGYVRDLALNLRAPLDATAHAELARGSELEATTARPARLWSLTSSGALVVNVFDYWRGHDTAPLAAALGLPQGSPTISYEEPLPTGLEGDPPTADVALRWPSGRIAAIESKFCEWLVRRPRNKAVFKRKYFPPGGEVWSAAGLPRCQELAADIDAGRERFRWLHAAQLLKHALGLARLAAPATTLVYLYYDWPSREATEHAAEVARFARRIAPDCDLRALTYQALYAALEAAEPLDSRYRTYLTQRYFR